MKSNGRTALVTGASAGIGHAICEQLLADGYSVVAMSRRPSKIVHERLHSVAVDLLDRSATEQAATAICAQHPITTIVHNAGAIRPAALSEVKLDDLNALVDLHIGRERLIGDADRGFRAALAHSQK